MKRIVMGIVGCTLLVVLFFIVGFNVGRSSAFQRPEDVLRSLLVHKGWTDAKDMVFPRNDRAESGGGFFILAEFPSNPTDHYHLFYGWLEKDQWQFVNVNTITPGSSGGGVPFNIGNNKQADFSVAAAWAPNDKAVQAIGTEKYKGLGKITEFSFEQLGNHPIWVHKFNSIVFLTITQKGYDAYGNVVWDMSY